MKALKGIGVVAGFALAAVTATQASQIVSSDSMVGTALIPLILAVGFFLSRKSVTI